jgi:hypothetical protein
MGRVQARVCLKSRLLSSPVPGLLRAAPHGPQPDRARQFWVLAVLWCVEFGPMLNDETGPLEEFIKRDDLRSPRVPPVELEGAKLGDVDPSVGLKLLKRADDKARTGFDVEQDFTSWVAGVVYGAQLVAEGLDCSVDGRLHLRLRRLTRPMAAIRPPDTDCARAAAYRGA